MSTKQEILIGNLASAQVESQYPVVADKAVTDPVDAVAARIIPVAQQYRSDVVFHVRVISSDDEDSFSLPGGWIYIDEGLVRKIGTDQDALACVIAHEAAHVVLHHAAMELADAYGTDSLVDMLTEGKYQEAANISLQLSLLSHSHQDEDSADRLGLKITRQAGYDPAGMLRFFAIVMAQPASSVEWVETHPLPKSRIKHVEQVIRDLNAGKY